MGFTEEGIGNRVILAYQTSGIASSRRDRIKLSWAWCEIHTFVMSKVEFGIDNHISVSATSHEEELYPLFNVSAYRTCVQFLQHCSRQLSGEREHLSLAVKSRLTHTVANDLLQKCTPSEVHLMFFIPGLRVNLDGVPPSEGTRTATWDVPTSVNEASKFYAFGSLKGNSSIAK